MIPMKQNNTPMNKKRILGITTHADDHIVFAGTVLKLQDAGYEYYELMLTNSSEGGPVNKSAKLSSSETTALRRKEFEIAAQLLNIKKSFLFDEEDQNLNYSKDLMHRVVTVIREVQPEIGITMNTVDVHPDHQAGANIAKEAFRWAAKSSFKPELGEGHRTKIVLFAEGTLPITPSALVDITPYYQRKEDLFKLYLSQASQRDLDLLKSYAIMRGYHLRTKDGIYAEAFSVEQNILPILF